MDTMEWLLSKRWALLLIGALLVIFSAWFEHTTRALFRLMS